MADFSTVQPEIMIAAAQAGADAVAEALQKAFGAEFSVATGDVTEAFLGADALMTSGRCLVLQAQMEGGCAVAVLPALAGLAPPWCGAPDQDEKAKLGALAQELFQAILPEDHPAINQRIDFVDDIAAIDQISFNDAANFVRISVESSGGKGDVLLIWPAGDLAELPPGIVDEHELVAEAEAQAIRDDRAAKREAPLDDVNISDDVTAAELAASLGMEAPPATDEIAPSEQPTQLAYSSVAEGLSQLPSYARNLLKIPVTVSAVLASKKMSVHDVHELSPGTIIEFTKSCEETLTLEVGDQLIAEGEAVRVGERFGIWVTQISMPDERFSCGNRRVS